MLTNFLRSSRLSTPERRHLVHEVNTSACVFRFIDDLDETLFSEDLRVSIRYESSRRSLVRTQASLIVEIRSHAQELFWVVRRPIQVGWDWNIEIEAILLELTDGTPVLIVHTFSHRR